MRKIKIGALIFFGIANLISSQSLSADLWLFQKRSHLVNQVLKSEETKGSNQLHDEFLYVKEGAVVLIKHETSGSEEIISIDLNAKTEDGKLRPNVVEHLQGIQKKYKHGSYGQFLPQAYLQGMKNANAKLELRDGEQVRIFLKDGGVLELAAKKIEKDGKVNFPEANAAQVKGLE